MHKVSRSLLFASVVALGGLAACGDDITIPPTPPTVQVTPNVIPVAVGATQQATATVSGAQGTAAVTWSTGNAAIATVDQNGVVTGVSNGNTSVTATVNATNGTAAASATVNVGGAGTAAVTIQGVNVTVCSPVTQDCNSVPATLNNISRQIDVTLNVETAGQPVERVELVVIDVASGAETVCGSQEITSAVVDAADAEAAAAQVPITISCNTARTTAAGIAEFLNGAKQIRARLIGANGQTINATTNTFNVTFANVDGLVWSVSNTGTNTGFPASAVGDEGLLWIQGNVTLNFTYVNYTSGAGAQAATVTGSMFGYNFSATPTAGQTFAVTFPAAGTYNVGTTRSLGGYTSADAGDAPVFTSVLTAGGQPVPAVNISAAANQAAVVRVDNAAPGVLVNVLPVGAANPAPLAPAYSGRTRFTAPFYVNGAFAFTGVAGAAPLAASTSNALVATGVDAGVNQNTVRFFAGATAGFPATGTAGLTEVEAGADLAASLTSSQYRTRALVSDALGNTVTVNSTNTFGVDLVAPQNLDFTGTSPADSTGFQANQTFAIDQPELTDDASGVASLRVTLTRRTSDATVTCPLGGTPAAGVCPTTTQTPGFTYLADVANDGYYTITITARDQAENVSEPITRTILVDDAAPVFVGGLTVPGQITPNGALSFMAQLTDNVDLGTEFLTAVYPALANPVRLDSVVTSTFGTPLVQSATPTVGTANFIASMAVATGGALPAAAGALATSANVVARDIALNQAISTAALPAGNFILTGANAAPVWNTFTGIASWGITAPAAAINIRNAGATAPANVPTTVDLTAELIGVAGNTTWDTPFTSVSFWYLDPTTGEYVSIGQATRTVITTGTTPNEVRTFRYEIADWNPPADLGGAANLTIIAIGNANGHALATDANTNITLVP